MAATRRSGRGEDFTAGLTSQLLGRAAKEGRQREQPSLLCNLQYNLLHSGLRLKSPAITE